MIDKIHPYVFLAATAIGTVSGDYFAKSWSLSGDRLTLYAAWLAYLLAGMFYCPLVSKSGLMVSSLQWMVLSTIGFTFIACVIFQEQLAPMQLGGVVLGIISLALLSI
jgi:multidrug transporter EmrE-like cation transporter